MVSTPPCKKKAAAWPKWKLHIIPCLIRPFLEIEEKPRNHQLPTALPTTVVDNAGFCLNEGYNRKLSTMWVQCINFKDIHHVDFTYCLDDECLGLHEQIVQCGYFPSSLEHPHTVFSLDILELFLAMNIQSTLGGSAFRQGIVHVLQLHGHEGFAKDPWKHQLSDTLTWFDVLKHDIELHVNRLLNDDVVEIGRSSDTEGSITGSHPSSAITEEQHSDETEQAMDSEVDAANLAHASLRQHCPACFGARAWGSAVEINPDVIVCIDGNFQHPQYSSVTDDLPLINPEELFMYLTLEELEKVKEHIEAQCDVDRPA
ncbi:hypothetical protein M422DRAFT_246270 [Sphaerobolus stellatus SS14]|nr:hypothetical protein M422DRAFT_246270 [Sphaerobolus stellatus SS14]